MVSPLTSLRVLSLSKDEVEPDVARKAAGKGPRACPQGSIMVRRLIKILVLVLTALLVLAVGFVGMRFVRWRQENEALKQIIARLEADSRIAQVLVTQVREDPQGGPASTTIKVLEFDSQGRPLVPRYFTFSGNIIQFQSLVVRFDDSFVRRGDKLKGKSAYLFLKVFFLNGPRTEVFDMTPLREIPEGYRINFPTAAGDALQQDFWDQFWKYALDPAASRRVGIKNAQIEAPGTKFIPGILYTIKIEHDGGMRIDGEPIPEILKGERIAP